MGDELEPAAHMSNASFAHSCSFSTKCPQPGGMRMTPRVYCRMMWTFWRHAKAMPSGTGNVAHEATLRALERCLARLTA